MKTVTGVFRSRVDAERALSQLQSTGVATDRTALLTPEHVKDELKTVPIVTSEQPGMGKAIGAVLGGAAGLSTGPLALAVVLPGVGQILGLGLLAGAVLAAFGAGVGAVAGEKIENSMTAGLPEDELFVYEDALRKGRTVLLAMAQDDQEAHRFHTLLEAEGAESIDAAREQWWIGLRSAEEEAYKSSGRSFGEDEKFYRMGFEDALHARSRCKEYDQVLAEMTAHVEDLQRQYPGITLADPYMKGYERGRDYYQEICDQAKAA